MKIDNYKMPKSSFLSVDKDLNILVEKILENERLKRLLYYTSKDAINKPNLSQKESLSLFNNNIKIVPKIPVSSEVKNYIMISFDNYTPNNNNPEFRDNTISFDIVCHLDQWLLEDNQLRPYRIAAEIDSMIDDKHLTGIGTTEFMGATQIILNDELAGLTLLYRVVHGGEDKIGMVNPLDEEQFLKDFKNMLGV